MGVEEGRGRRKRRLSMMGSCRDPGLLLRGHSRRCWDRYTLSEREEETML